MKTTQEMQDFAINNNYTYGKNENAKKHFEIIERSLSNNEEVLFTFTSNGVKNKADSLILGGIMAIALTDKRLIYAQRRAILGDVVKFLNYTYINDISSKKGWLDGTLIIDSPTEYMNFSVNKNIVENLANSVMEVIENCKNKNSTPMVQVTQTPSIADEIKKYKELLDMGAITQEEFDSKKKQLLG